MHQLRNRVFENYFFKPNTNLMVHWAALTLPFYVLLRRGQPLVGTSSHGKILLMLTLQNPPDSLEGQVSQHQYPLPGCILCIEVLVTHHHVCWAGRIIRLRAWHVAITLHSKLCHGKRLPGRKRKRFKGVLKSSFEKTCRILGIPGLLDAENEWSHEPWAHILVARRSLL